MEKSDKKQEGIEKDTVIRIGQEEKEKDTRQTVEEYMEDVPEIEWDDAEEEPIKVTGNKLKGTIRVTQGDKFVEFKRKLSERKVNSYGKIGTDSFVLDKDLKPTAKDDVIEMATIKDSDLEKSIFLQTALLKAWSKKEKITAKNIEDDEELVDIRAVAVKYMVKENKLGNFKKEKKKKV